MKVDYQKEYRRYVKGVFAKTGIKQHADLVAPYVIDQEKGLLIYEQFGIPVLFEPLFIARQKIDQVAKQMELADELLLEIVELIKTEQKIRRLLEVSDLELELLRAKSAVEAQLPFWRADMNLAAQLSSCVEFNTDAARGRGLYDDMLNNFSRTKLMQGFFQRYPELKPQQDLDLMTDIYDLAAEQFEAFSGLPAEQMRVACLIWRDHEFVDEIAYYRDYWRERGVEAELIDPRDIEFNGTKVTANGQDFNFIARWVDLDKIIDKKCFNLIKAYQAGAISMFPTLTSGIAGKKAVFEILSDPQYQEYFDADKWQEVNQIIAWTRRLENRESVLPDGSRANLVEFTIANKDQLVIKASVGTEGKEVIIGQDVRRVEWEQQVKQVVGEDWIVQEYVQWSSQEFLRYSAGQLQTFVKNYDFLPAVTNGKYSAGFSRAADGNVLNFIAGATIALQYYY